MERLKTSLFLCVLLACVAPAMAADYMAPNAVINTHQMTEWTTSTYNPTPDPTALSDWLATSYTAPFDVTDPSVSRTAPYWSYETTTTGPGASDNIRFQDSYGGTLGVTTTITNDVTYFGDAYFPYFYSSKGYPLCIDRAELKGPTWSMNVMNYGQEPGKLPTITQASDGFGYPFETFASSSHLQVKNGTLNIGEIRVTNTDTHYDALGGWGETRNVIKTRLGNATQGTTTFVNIGDIYLNRTMTAIQIMGGTVKISGNIGLNDAVGATEGRFFLQLNAADAYVGTGDIIDPTEGGVLLIQESVLLQLIEAGQLLTNNASVTGNAEHYAGTVVTLGNMYSELDIRSADAGLVRVTRIPEPATLVLLGLGCVALRRRKY